MKICIYVIYFKRLFLHYVDNVLHKLHTILNGVIKTDSLYWKLFRSWI